MFFKDNFPVVYLFHYIPMYTCEAVEILSISRFPKKNDKIYLDRNCIYGRFYPEFFFVTVRLGKGLTSFNSYSVGSFFIVGIKKQIFTISTFALLISG